MEKYEVVRELGSGNFGVARLMRHKETKQLVAMKCIPRGHKIGENVAREIINHRSLRHPNIIRFKEVALTPTYLAIVMEYAAGGELFDRICADGRFSEDEARFFFQQLISGVSYCHFMKICHRDLKLENTLLDGSPVPRLKICDFGYSKSSLLHSRPKSAVGTPAYIAPEVLSRREYDGKLADVWSCGVTLYVMLVGAYPFEDPEDPRNIRKTIGRIASVQYKIPDRVHVSEDCKHLLSRIFVTNPMKRIKISEIKKHPWFLKSLPKELTDTAQAVYFKDNRAQTYSPQSVEDIMKIVEEARSPPPSSTPVPGWAEDESINRKLEEEEEEEEDEYEKQVKEVQASGEYQIRLYNHGIGIHLLQCNSLDEVPKKKGIINPKDNHISFQCSDLYLLKRKLEEMGIEYVTAVVEDSGIQVDQLFFHDPDGYMVEICNCDNFPMIPLSSCPLKFPYLNNPILSSLYNGKGYHKLPLGSCGAEAETVIMEALVTDMMDISF